MAEPAGDAPQPYPPVFGADEDCEAPLQRLDEHLQVSAEPGADDVATSARDGDKKSFILVADHAVDSLPGDLADEPQGESP